MKARLPPQRLTNAEFKAMNCEINKQIIEQQKRWDADFEAMIAWTLYSHYGFSVRKLLNFRKFFYKEYQELKKFFKMDDAYPAKYKLKQVGYDVEKLIKEDEMNGIDQ